MSARLVLIRVLVGSSLLIAGAACSSSSHKSAATTTTTTRPASTSTSTSTPTSAAPSTTAGASTTSPPATITPSSIAHSGSTTPQPCASGPKTPPAGAAHRTVADVDGDGKADVAWMTGPSAQTGTVTFGISTATGGATVPIQSASPIARRALVANVDQQGPAEIIVSDGRGARLYAWSKCSIAPVLNPQGQQYAFDLGDRIGTGSGIGCVTTPSGQKLVGLNITSFSPNSSTIHWSRTIIDLDGLKAHNGLRTTGTFHSPAQKAQIALLQEITCGQLTMAKDGVSNPT